MQANEPMFNVPRAVAAILILLVVVHLLRHLLDPETDLWLVFAAAFIPARFDSLGAALPGGETARFTSWVTYMLLHGDWMHLAVNSAWLLVFGTSIARRTSELRFAAFFVASGVAGAFAFYLWNPGLMAPVVGASGAVAGLMGGTMRVLYSTMDSGGLRALSSPGPTAPLVPLLDALRDRRLLLASVVIILMNALAAVGFGIAQEGTGIAWEAHIGGYLAGLLSIGWFDGKGSASNQKES